MYLCTIDIYTNTNIKGLDRRMIVCAIDRKGDFYIVEDENRKTVVSPLGNYVDEKRGINFEFSEL